MIFNIIDSRFLSSNAQDFIEDRTVDAHGQQASGNS